MNTNRIARIASLVGEPARTAMLLELMDGRSLTARELATAARVSPQTASRHLAQLVDGGLLRVEAFGRHRYHRLAGREVAEALESLMQLAARGGASPRPTFVPGPKDAGLRMARTCYDHLAGRLGVAIAEHLHADGALVFDGEIGHLTERGRAALARIGIAGAVSPSNRLHCRRCLDWSERRFHLAGRLGALLCAHCLEHGWLLRRPGTRALQITPKGAVGLRDWLGHARWEQVVGAFAATAKDHGCRTSLSP